MRFYTGLAAATAAFSAVIAASLIGLMGHFDSLQERIGVRKVDKCTLIKSCLPAPVCKLSLVAVGLTLFVGGFALTATLLFLNAEKK